MNRWTAFFLILLRLAIGWHFLFEGIQKVQSVTSPRPFSSASYFREAPGPLGVWYRQLEGDPDDKLLARLEVLPPPGDGDEAKLYLRIPPGLQDDYDNYLVRFTTHYGLSDEQKQLLEQRAVKHQHESSTVRWLTYVRPADEKKMAAEKDYPLMVSSQTRSFPTGEVKRLMTMPERIDEYKARLAELRDTTDQKLWAMGRDVEGPRLRQLKGHVASLRRGLQDDLDARVADYGKALHDAANLSDEQKAKGPVPARQERDIIGWVDWGTRWGLTVVGACLIVGLLTRLNCLVAGLFLLGTYLAVPAFPWVPAPPASEGNYLFVNKNVVEMLALFVLMTTASGRWFGLDAIIHRVVFGADKGEPGA